MHYGWGLGIGAAAIQYVYIKFGAVVHEFLFLARNEDMEMDVTLFEARMQKFNLFQ